MALLKSLATSLAGRTAVRRLGRAIPNPLLRRAAITAATVLTPIVVRRVSSAIQQRKMQRSLARGYPSQPDLGLVRN